MSGPLQGVRVLELSDGLAGAQCGSLLAWLGADVLLVERPRSGSAVRWLAPFADDRVGAERGGLFLYTASGKRSITLDPKAPDGRAIWERLLASAAILVEDRSEPLEVPSGMTKLVHVRFAKFAANGPRAGYVATELELGALGGWMVQVGESGRTPLSSNSATMTAFVPGTTGAIAAVASLRRAEREGLGERIEISARESLLFCTRYNETYFSYTGTEIRRLGTRFTGWSPTYGVFRAADGWVTCAASTDAQVELLMQLAGIDAKRFPTREIRYEKTAEFLAALGEWFGARTKEDIFHTAQAWRIPMGQVVAFDEVERLEQLAVRGFFVEIDHPSVGRRTYPGAPAKVPGSPRTGRAPLLGEHTADVLCGELGYSREDFAALAASGVV